MAQELWTSKAPHLKYHFRVFGCEAYVHVPKQPMKKLDFKCRNLFFLVMESMGSLDITYGIVTHVLWFEVVI